MKTIQRNDESIYRKIKERKKIYSITLDQDLYEDAMKVAPDGNFSKFVTIALEEYIERQVELSDKK